MKESINAGDSIIILSSFCLYSLKITSFYFCYNVCEGALFIVKEKENLLYTNFRTASVLLSGEPQPQSRLSWTGVSLLSLEDSVVLAFQKGNQ